MHMRIGLVAMPWFYGMSSSPPMMYADKSISARGVLLRDAVVLAIVVLTTPPKDASFCKS